MKDTRTTEEKIKAYISAGYFDKKPRLTTPQVVEYANANGAEWTISSSNTEKRTKSAGMRYTTGGGTRSYSGYKVYSANGNKNGFASRVEIYDSTETYRTIGDLIRKLPNYSNLN